jgi:hypothetical protein
MLMVVAVLATLWTMSVRPLRLALLGLLAQFAAASSLSANALPRAEVLLIGAASLGAVIVLYIAAGDGSFGEEPGWRIWPTLAAAAVATVIAFNVLSSTEVDRFLQVTAFWLLAAGMSTLLGARTAVRMVVGGMLMLSGTQLVLRFQPGSHLALSTLFAWVELIIALAGAFLIVNQRALEES